MALADYRQDMETCCRCSACKFIPLERVTGYEHVAVCPSIARYNFHAYSGGGRLGIGIALLEGELDYSDKLVEIVYNCQMCGGCDVSCKYAMDMDVLEPINAVRIECVNKGKTLPALDKLIANLRLHGTMLPSGASNSKSWFEGLNLRDYTRQKVDLIYHAGCRIRHDPTMWKIARYNVLLLQKAGLEPSIAVGNELCCGGRAYEMGYLDDFLRQASAVMKRIEQSGAKTLVTGCADCYYAFKVLYDKFNLRSDLKILHSAEIFADLISSGRLQPQKEIPLKITYHDPCHLGRLGEPYIHWQGKQLPGHIRLFDPPREFRRGTKGVYDPPREVLKSIPGIRLLEMDRRKEYAWCCGAGGGVKESNPTFAEWTALQRLQEAGTTGAEAIVTACPGCEKNLKDALKKQTGQTRIYDISELLTQSVLKEELDAAQ